MLQCNGLNSIVFMSMIEVVLRQFASHQFRLNVQKTLPCIDIVVILVMRLK